MATTTKRSPTPVDEYILGAPQEIRGRFEYFDGGWHEKPMSGWRHNNVSAYLVVECERRGLRASFDVITQLPIGEERHPDVLVVGPSNPNQPGTGEYHGVPDLVMELLSEGNPGAYDDRKRESYRLAGVRHYWLVRLGPDVVEPATLVNEAYVWGEPFPLFPLEALPLPADL
jgi:Uma2 family endonuclease